MDWHDAALAAAGAIGSATALVHGVLTQRLMVRPIQAALADRNLPRAVRRLVPVLLQFSTFAWLLGGLALVAAAWCSDREAKLATGLLVGAFYLFGALGNAWATRGRHPGWMLMAAAAGLIGFGLSGGWGVS
jgi:hypothetical protein